MKSATITLRSKTTTFTYRVITLQGLTYAIVTWADGKTTHFYKGMYGVPDRWENNKMPNDLILVVSDIFNKEEPEQGDWGNVVTRG